MKKVELRELARERMLSLQAARLMEPLTSRYPGFTLADGYAVAEELVCMRRRQGEHTVGRKIGFTNQTIWKECGLETPIWAHVYDRSVRLALDNRAEIPLKGTCLPRIEPEIVFKIGKVPLPVNREPEELLGHIEWLALGFEVVDSHYPDWRFRPADAVADFGLHHALAVGAPLPVPLQGRGELAGRLAKFRLNLKNGGRKVAEGIGKNVLGNPLLALDFLNRIIGSEQGADPLQKGEIITTGTLTKALPVAPGQVWSAEVEGIPLSPFRLELLGEIGNPEHADSD